MNEQYRLAIMQVVHQIPAGNVATYGQVAELAGLPGAARLVGHTLKTLPSGSSLPWYRVINSSGKISLPHGSPGYQLQTERLQSEGVTLINGRVNLKRYRWQP